VSTSYAIFTFSGQRFSDEGDGIDAPGACWIVRALAGTGMTIKLVIMAVMYGVVVLAPRFFPRVKAEPAQRG
jgi:hypothetical protein